MTTAISQPRLADGREVHQDRSFLRDLRNLHSSVRHLPGQLAVPPYAFAPDDWSFHLLEALRALDLTDRRVLEVGVGTGFVALCLLCDQPDIKRLYAADIDPRLPELAARNAARILDPETRARFQPCPGANNLLSWFAEADHPLAMALPRPDVIYGCVPQVPLPQGTQLDSRDNAANYYPAEEFPSRYNRVGLGLNDHLLRQAKHVLAPGGQIVLNLAGRVGLDTLLGLFSRWGYRSRVLRKTLVPQHVETSLEPYALVEEETADTTQPLRFQFYVDDAPGERRSVDARTAESLRQAGKPCFHTLYAIRGEIR